MKYIYSEHLYDESPYTNVMNTTVAMLELTSHLMIQSQSASRQNNEL